jgi:hypothetical protein
MLGNPQTTSLTWDGVAIDPLRTRNGSLSSTLPARLATPGNHQLVVTVSDGRLSQSASRSVAVDDDPRR